MRTNTQYSLLIHKQVIDALKAGATIKSAAALVGLSPETIRSWINKGKTTPDTLFSGFAFEAEQAMALARAQLEMKWHDMAVNGQRIQEVTVIKRRETKMNRDGELVEETFEEERVVTRDVPADWRASGEYLRRQDPEEWSARDQLVDEGSGVVIVFNQTPPKERFAAIAPDALPVGGEPVVEDAEFFEVNQSVDSETGQ